MLKQRVITGTVMLAVIVAVLCFSEISWIIMGFAAIISALAVWELYRGAGFLSGRPKDVIPLAAALIFACGFSFVPLHFYDKLSGVGCVLAATACGVLRFRFERVRLRRRWIVFLAALVLPVLYGAVVYLRAMERGLFYLILTLLCCFGTDTAAYFTGMALGRHKLAPRISPKKTVEGFVGGVVFNAILFVGFGLMVSHFYDIKASLWALALLGLCGGAVDQFGDLSVSMFKRKFEIKDFGNILPGHGGVLDRFDSLLFVAPFLYLFVIVFDRLFI